MTYDYGGNCDWPTFEELKRLVNVDPQSTIFDVTIQRQLDAGIALVKSVVGVWDELFDCPDDRLRGAALRAAYLLSIREAPPAIIADPVFSTYMAGHRRRFPFS
jgi:hypothetical protein